LGENFQLAIVKAEGVEKGVSDLPPNLKFLWRENSIGKTSTLSAGIEDFSSMQYFKNLVPTYVQKLKVYDYCSSFFRVATQSSKMYIQSDGFVFCYDCFSPMIYSYHYRYITDAKETNVEILDTNSVRKPNRLDYSVQGFAGQLQRLQLPRPIHTLTPFEEKEEAEIEKNRFLSCHQVGMCGLKSVLRFANQKVGNIYKYMSITLSVLNLLITCSPYLMCEYSTKEVIADQVLALTNQQFTGLLGVVNEKGIYPFNQVGFKIDFNPIVLRIADRFDSLTSIFKLSLNTMRYELFFSKLCYFQPYLKVVGLRLHAY